MVQFVQFKKREKHPWLQTATLLKVTLFLGCISRFLNCTNGTKSRNASHKFSPSKSLSQKETEPTRQLGLDNEILLVLKRIRPRFLNRRFSILIWNFCWTCIKFFYNHHNFFSQRMKTIDFLGNIWANFVIEISLLLRWF